MNKKVRLFTLFTCAHAIFTLGCMFYSMDFGRFDNPDLPQSFSVTAAGAAANVLMLPGLLIWTSWASKNLPNAVQWLLFIGNSALWGLVGVALVNGWRRIRSSRSL